MMIWHHYLRYREICLIAFMFVQVNPFRISEQKQKECHLPPGTDSCHSWKAILNKANQMMKTIIKRHCLLDCKADFRNTQMFLKFNLRSIFLMKYLRVAHKLINFRFFSLNLRIAARTRLPDEMGLCV